MLSIKNATTINIDAIIALNLQVWPHTYSAILPQEQIAYMLQAMYSPQVLQEQMSTGHTFILCYNDDELVGFAAFSRIKEEIHKLHKIYILPGKQGLGIGTFMLNHITNIVAGLGAKFLELNVNRYNHNAKAFYDKAGFTTYREEDIDIGGGYYMNDYVLRLPL